MQGGPPAEAHAQAERSGDVVASERGWVWENEEADIVRGCDP
jgi:hypothetical protein